MIGLFTSIIQIIHIWMFTSAFQVCFDVFVDFKFDGYWYFKKGEIEWLGLLPHLVLVPPVNIMFLNWYPFSHIIFLRLIYVGGGLYSSFYMKPSLYYQNLGVILKMDGGNYGIQPLLIRFFSLSY